MQFIILTFLIEINEIILKRVCLVIFINTISWVLNYFRFIIPPRFIMPKFSFYLWKPVHYPVEVVVWAVCWMFNSMKKGQPLFGSCCLSVCEVAELRVNSYLLQTMLSKNKQANPEKEALKNRGDNFFDYRLCIWKSLNDL